MHKEEAINNNQMSELREKIEEILDENIDNDANWRDGPNPEKVVKAIATLIQESNERVAEKLFKTLLCIEGVNSDDFAEEMDMKRADKKKFTQEEAKEFSDKMITTYHLSHNIVADCCRNTHNDLLEKVYKGLIDSNFIGSDTLKESLSEYLSSKETDNGKGKTDND